MLETRKPGHPHMGNNEKFLWHQTWQDWRIPQEVEESLTTPHVTPEEAASWGLVSAANRKSSWQVMSGVGWDLMVTFSFFFSIALSNDSDLEDSYRRWQTFYPVLFALCSEIPCSIMYGHSYLSSVWPWDVFTLSCLWGFFMGVWKAQIKVCDHFFTYPRKTRLIL